MDTNYAQIAVDACDGNQSELARRIGATPQVIQHWVRNGRIPPKRLEDVCRVTGLPAAKLDPDLAKLFASA